MHYTNTISTSTLHKNMQYLAFDVLMMIIHVNILCNVCPLILVVLSIIQVYKCLHAQNKIKPALIIVFVIQGQT